MINEINVDITYSAVVLHSGIILINIQVVVVVIFVVIVVIIVVAIVVVCINNVDHCLKGNQDKGDKSKC